MRTPDPSDARARWLRLTPQGEALGFTTENVGRQLRDAMDGAIAMLPCVSLNYYEPCEECVNEKACGIRDSFIGVRDETLRILSESTLRTILEKEKL